MAVPYLIGGGGSNVTAGTGGDLVLTIPATPAVLANDIIVIYFNANDNVAATFPGGWTVIQDVTNTAGQRAQAAWKRAAGGEQGSNVTVTHPGGSACQGIIMVYRGCKPTGNPAAQSAAQGNASSVTCTAPTVTPAAVPSLLVFATMMTTSANVVTPSTNTKRGAMWLRGPGGIRVGENEAPVFEAVALGTSTGTYDAAGVNVGMNIILEGDPAGTDCDQDNNSTVGTGFSKHGTGSIGGVGGSGLNGIAIGIVLTWATDGVPAVPTSVLYNSVIPATGTPMTMLRSITFDNNITMSVWYLLGVTSGSSIVFRALFSKVMAFNMQGRHFVDVDQTTPFDPLHVAEFTGASTAPAGTVNDVNVADLALGILGLSGAAGTITKDAGQTNSINPVTGAYGNSGAVFNGMGPYRMGLTMTTESGGDNVTNSWTMTTAVPWQLLLLELRNTAAPPYVPPTYANSCTLSTIQLRADHITHDFGVSGASALVPVGALLGYCYAGQIDPPPTPVVRGDNRVIFFRTYDPMTQTFGTPVVVEGAESYNDPAGDGTGGTVTASYWDYPKLLKLADNTLVCIWGRSDLGYDSQSFFPTDTTMNGGGIFVRESTDDGLHWSTRVDVAPVLMSQGAAATDGTDVWIWSNQHDNALNTNKLAYLGHYSAPTFTMKLYKRSAAWAASTVYTARLSTRTLQGAGPYGDSHDDGLDINQLPASCAHLVDSSTGFVIGMRTGTSASSSPLTGPGTLPVGPSVTSIRKLMCWRTTNGGTSWVESQIGGLDTTTLPGGSQSLAIRIKVAPSGRIYATFKCAPNTINLHHVTSSGAGNRTLTISAPDDASYANFSDVLVGGALTGNAAFAPGTTLFSKSLSTIGTASADLLSPIVDGTITCVIAALQPFHYSRVIYSDDNGATWTSPGFITQTVQEVNPQAERTLNQYGVDGSTCLTLDTDGIAYLATLSTDSPSDPGLRSFVVFQSDDTVDADPTTFSYFGCFPMPDEVDFGGWKEASSEIYYQDGRCYVLEQFERDTTGREELWIMGYPVPVTIPEIPQPPESTRMFRRGVIQAQRGKFRNARRAPGSIATWRKL